MKFHIKHLYDGCTKFSEKGHDSKFKIAAMPIYGKTIQTTSFPEPLGQFG